MQHSGLNSSQGIIMFVRPRPVLLKTSGIIVSATAPFLLWGEGWGGGEEWSVLNFEKGDIRKIMSSFLGEGGVTVFLSKETL